LPAPKPAKAGFLLWGFQQVIIANRFAPGLWCANLKGKDHMEARISLRAVWFALKRRHQAVQEWNQQAVSNPAYVKFALRQRRVIWVL